jgi:hypothetical protein
MGEEQVMLWTKQKYSIVLGWFFLMNNVFAAQKDGLLLSPPQNYLLSQVNISFLYQANPMLHSNYEITLSGNGQGEYVLHKASESVRKEFKFSEESVMQLLNDIYKSHFFELSDTYTLKKRVILKSDNQVVTMALKMNDVSSQQFCIQLADYKKCLTVMDEQPAQVVQIINQLVNKVQMLTQ